MTALVSVVIPAHNAESVLPSAIASACQQTHEEVEVLVVDDCSRDGTSVAARAFNDPRLRVLRGLGRGVGAARNVALAEARGDYVAFLDADDYWLPQKLERQLSSLRAEESLAAVGALMRYEPLSERRAVGIAGRTVTDADQCRIARGLYVPFPLSSLVAPRSLLEDIGGFDEELRSGGDLELMAQLARRGRMHCIPEVLGAYRVHGASISATRFWEQARNARFIVARLAALDRGESLTRDAFEATDRLSLSQRHRLLGRYLYRSAGIAYAERRWAAAALQGVAAVATSPGYALRRAARQRRDVVSSP